MKLLFIALSLIGTVQAFQSTGSLTIRTLAEKSKDTRPKNPARQTHQVKRPSPDSGPGPSQGRDVHQRLPRARVEGQSLSTNQHVNLQSQGSLLASEASQLRSQSSESSRSHSRGRGSSQLKDSGHTADLGRSPARNALSSQKRSSGRASVNKGATQARMQGQPSRQNHKAIKNHGRSRSPSPYPSQSTVLEDQRFPSPTSGILAPDRNKHVQIHTAIAGPARVIGRLGYPLTQHQELNLAAGQSLNKLWTDPYQAEIHITNHAGNQGINRSWAAGGRRASVRSDNPTQVLALGGSIGLGGPTTHLNAVRNDQQHGGMGYLKASTRSYENHVAVDSMTQGEGLTVVRASNSRAGTVSRPSSLSDTESEGDSVSNAPM